MFDTGYGDDWPTVAGPEPCCPLDGAVPCEHERALVARLAAEEARLLTETPLSEDDVVPEMIPEEYLEDAAGPELPPVGATLDGTSGSAGLSLAITLEQVTLAGLDGAGLVEAAAAWSRVEAWAHARVAEAAARLTEELHHLAGPLSDPRLDGMPTGSTPERLAATELSMRLSTTRQSAESLVRTARLLDGPLQATAEALERGEIDARKADVIARALQDAPLPIALAVEDAVLPRAPRRTHPQLVQDLAKALIEVDPEEAQTRHRRARAKRRVNHPRALPDGMASVLAVLPAEDAVALDLALDSAARTAKAGGDGRTIDQLRADALASVGIDALRTGWLGASAHERRPDAGAPTDHTSGRPHRTHPPDAANPSGPAANPSGPPDPGPPGLSASFPLGRVGGEPVRVHVTVPLSSLLGGAGAAELEGYGPIDAVTARALALGGTWRRLVTDPLSGTVLDVGRSRYRPPPDLARHVRARDRTCFRPGCGARAQSCELDHTIPFGSGPGGGRTAEDNLGAGCSTDHGLKTRGDFRVRQLPGGVFEWTSRTGLTYRRESDGSITFCGRTMPAAPRRRSTFRLPRITDLGPPD